MIIIILCGCYIISFKSGFNISRQLDTYADYVATLTNDKKQILKKSNSNSRLNDLAITFSLSGRDHELKHLGALTQITLNSSNLLVRYKSMLVDAFLSDSQNIQYGLDAKDTSTNIQNIKTLRNFDKEKPKLRAGIQLRYSLLQTFSELSAYRKQAQSLYRLHKGNIDALSIDRGTLSAKTEQQIQAITSNLSQVKANLASIQGEIIGNQAALSSIEEVEKKYADSEILKKKELFKNLTFYKQELDDAIKYAEDLEEGQKEIVAKFEKHKNNALEEKDMHLKMVNQRKNEASETIQSLQTEKHAQLREIDQQQQQELKVFESEKNQLRSQFNQELGQCNNEIANASKLTAEERKQDNGYQLSIQLHQKDIENHEQKINDAFSDITRLKADQVREDRELEHAISKLKQARSQSDELEAVLYGKNSLLSFLNQGPNQDWKETIAKVINPKLFLNDKLNPSWINGKDQSSSGLYGLHLDLSKLDIPMEADSLEVLEQRLRDAKRDVQNFDARLAAAKKNAASAKKSFSDAELNLHKLQTEFKQLKEKLHSTNRVYGQYKQTVEKNIELRRSEAESRRNQVYEKMNGFDQQTLQERNMIYQRYEDQKVSSQKSFDHKINEQTQRKVALDARIKEAENKYVGKLADLTRLLDAELQQNGVDITIHHKAKDRVEHLSRNYHVIKNYESAIIKYDAWLQRDFAQKGQLVEKINQLKAQQYQCEQSHQALQRELDEVSESTRQKLNQINEKIASLDSKNNRLAAIGSQINDVIADVPTIEEIEMQDAVSFELFVRNTEDALVRQREQVRNLKRALDEILRIFRQNDDIYKQWKSRAELVVVKSDVAEYLNGMQSIEALLEQDMPIKEQITIDKFRLICYHMKNYSESLAKFRRKLKAVSKDLTELTNNLNRFPSISEIQVDVLSALDGMDVYEYLNSFVNDFNASSLTEDSESLTLPSESLVESFIAASKALESLNIKTLDIHSLVKLNIGYKENNRAVPVCHDSDLSLGSSTGLSRIITIVMFIALTRKLCSDQKTVIHVPLDEIGQFDLPNMNRMFGLMEEQGINLVCAQPNLPSELSNSFTHKHDVDRKHGVRKFVIKKPDHDNPLLNQ